MVIISVPLPSPPGLAAPRLISLAAWCVRYKVSLQPISRLCLFPLRFLLPTPLHGLLYVAQVFDCDLRPSEEMNDLLYLQVLLIMPSDLYSFLSAPSQPSRGRPGACRRADRIVSYASTSVGSVSRSSS